LRRAVRYPIVIDGRNLYPPAVMQEHGFMYLSMGRSAPSARNVSAPKL
jgi:UDPglucose 6-dehydrogenase